MLHHPHPPTAIPFPSFPSSRRPHFHCHISSNATHPTTHLAATATATSSSASASGAGGVAATDAELLALLRSGDTDAAYALFSSTPRLPSPTCLSRLLAQLSYQKHSPTSFPRALALLRRLRAAGELRRLDSNSLSLAVSAASRSGHAPLASSLLLSMLRHGHLPDARAYTTTISRLSDPAASLRLFAAVLRHLRRLGGAAAASSALPDTAAFNAALNAAADLGDARRFRGLFDDMPYWKIKPDALSYNIVIKMCARAGRRDLVARALEQIILSDLTPCVTTMHSLVAAYVGFDDLETAEKIVQAMREQRKDLCLILREAKNGNAGGALEEDSVVLEEIFGKSAAADGEPPLLPKTYVPDSRVYTTLMKGYMKAGRVEDVVRTVRAMRREGESDPASRPDHVTYTTVVSALAGAGEMDRARAVLGEMAWAGVPANRVTYNVLLKGYCQQLQMDRAKELVREMPGAGIEPDVVSYNILIDGCVLVDDSAGALACFNEMRARGIAPSGVSYTTLMKAFALSGQAKLARKVFDEMDKDPRVKVDRVAWNMLVEGYCRLGLIEEAKRIVERMKERGGAQPDVATYGSLANGISLARRPGEALLLWNEVKERCQGRPPLRPDEGLLDTLADVCVRAAFFKKALEIVACMEEHGIAPNKTKYKKIYIEMHSRMFTSKHASQARQDRRKERKRAAEAFKFWLGLPNEYYGSEWRLEPLVEDGYELS